MELTAVERWGWGESGADGSGEVGESGADGSGEVRVGGEWS